MKRNTNRWLAALLMLGAVTVVVSCSDNDPENWQGVVQTDNGADEIYLPAKESELCLHIGSNAEWRVETDCDWIVVAPTVGTGDADIKLYIEPNDEYGRSGVVTVQFPKAHNLDAKIHVQQDALGDVMTGGEFDGATFLGYGYNIFGPYASPSGKTTGQVLSTAKLKAHQDSIDNQYIFDDDVLGTDYTRVSEYKTRSGSSYEEVSRSFEISADISTKFLKFSAEMKASFSSNTNEQHENEYAIYTYQEILGRRFINRSAVDECDRWLTSAARDAINGTSRRYAGTDGIAQLIKNYGTHVLIGGYLGGRIDYSMVVDKEKSKGDFDIKAMVKGGYGSYFNLEVDADYKEAYEKNKSACTTSVKSIGGNVLVTSASDFSAWYDGVVNNGKSVLMDFEEGDLVPIWEFCQDEERANQIINYVLGDYYSAAISDIYNERYKHLTLPTFESAENATLVQRAYVDGVAVAELCNEYIYGLSGTERRTVVYPIVDGVVRFDAGFFPGSQNTSAAKVVWTLDKVTPTIQPITNDAGGGCDIYLKGVNISTEPPLGITDYVECDVQPYYMRAFNQNELYDYPVVKIGNDVWTRQDFAGKRYINGNTLDEAEDGYYIPGVASEAAAIGWTGAKEEQLRNLQKYVGDRAELLRAPGSLTGFDATSRPYGYFNVWYDVVYMRDEFRDLKLYTGQYNASAYIGTSYNYWLVIDRGDGMTASVQRNPYPYESKYDPQTGHDIDTYPAGQLRFVRKR